MSDDRYSGASPRRKPAQHRAPAGRNEPTTLDRTTSRSASAARQRRESRSTAPGARLYSDRPRTANQRKGATGAKPSLMGRIWAFIRRIGLAIAGGALAFYHLFDRFRTSESKRIVTNTLLAGALILLLASAFMLLKPSVDASRAIRQAEKGNSIEAMQLLSSAQKQGLGETRLDKTRLKMAAAFTDQGSYTLARQLTGEMGDAAKAAAQNSKIDYAEASKLYGERAYAGAAQLFYRLGNYLDSDDRYRDCLCAVAVEAYIAGSEARARSLLAELEDAESRLSRVLKDMGRGDLMSDPLFSAENLKTMRENYALLMQTRQTVQKGRIAAGARHSLALRSDGTVLASGDNSRGQCNVGSWSGITMLAAGRMHSVGLRSDGTVVACGDNSEGQCNVGSWSDIVSVAAGSYVTVGVRRDGSVVYCGRGYSAMEAWKDVEAVSAGGYSVAALTQNGTMLCSHSAALLPVDVRMFDVAVSGQVSVGILYDGSLISSLNNTPDWRELKCVAAGESGIFAVTLSGEVRAHYFRSGTDFNIRISSGAEEIAVSASHALVLTGDGRIYAFGDNSYGQCAINGSYR